MTDQNNPAQSAEHETAVEALERLLSLCKKEQTRGVKISREELRALLSKLRAEGVQAGDERAAYTDPLSDFQEGQWWVKELDALAQAVGATHDQKRAVAVVHHMLRAAALASAPVAGWGCAHKNKVANAAAYVWYCRDCCKFIRREPGDSEPSSAPVAATRGPVKERADFAIWLTRTFPSLYTSADAARFLDDGHQAALAWQAHWTAGARISTLASAPVADERISLLGAANLAFNALHECKPAKGAEKQYSDAIQALQSALHDIAYTVNRTATPQQFADHLQREARAALASASVADESPMAKVAEALREKARQEQQAYQDRRAQATEWGPMPTGTQADDPSELGALADGLESIVGNENAALAAAYIRREAKRLASAVGDVTAKPVAWVAGDDASRYLEWDKERSAWEMPIGTPVFYAAPQASEAVRSYRDSDDFHSNASAAELGAWQRGWDDCRASDQTQADKDGGDCAKGTSDHEKMREVLQWIVDDAASGGVAKLRPQQEKRARAALSAQPGAQKGK